MIHRLDALGADGEYRSRNTEVITDTAGTAVTEMTMTPPLFVSRTLSAQRKAGPATGYAAALGTAAGIFVSDLVGGLDFDDYVRLTSRVSGLPLTVARAGALAVAAALTDAAGGVAASRPVGARADWRELPADGGAAWARRGELLAVLAPGNAPGVHGLWPQALLMGYRVAVRPSRREPFTAHRLIQALRRAGVRDIDAVYLPTDHRGAGELVQGADLALIYGAQDVVDRYAADPTVLTNGPGRTKILVTAEQNWRDHLDVIVDSVAALGGMACVNATAVLVEGDPGHLAAALAERLAVMPALPNTSDGAVLPTVPLVRAQALARHVAATAAGSVALLGADQMVADLGDGNAVLRPAVHLLGRPDPATLNAELPFPCVWVAPWSRADGVAPLRKSLVLTAITDDDDLVDTLLAEPTITNVYRGPVPTHHAAAHIPHEGYLADFLMRNKGFVRR